MYRRLVTTVGDVMDTQVRTLEEDLDVRPCEHNYQANCNNCRLGGICLPFALESKEIDELDSIVRRSKPMQKGQHVYNEGEEFRSVFAVRSGMIKAYRTTDDGREQVTGFYFPGEILGMDGIGSNAHASSAKALETSKTTPKVHSLPRDRRRNVSSHFLRENVCFGFVVLLPRLFTRFCDQERNSA